MNFLLCVSLLAMKHIRHSLEGCQFAIYTDYHPLMFLLHSKPDKYSPRGTRHFDFISQFTSDIRHITGEQDVVADTLSRLSINSLSSPSDIDLQQIASNQSCLDTLDLSSPDFCYQQIYISTCTHLGHTDNLRHLDRFTYSSCSNDSSLGCF